MHRTYAFRPLAALLLAALLAVPAASPAEAGGFLQWMFGRAVVRGTAAAAGASSGGTEVAKQPKTYDENTLTVDQLAGCLKSSQDLDRDREALSAQSAAYDTRKSDLDYAKAKLAAEQAKLDGKRTKAAVAAYNERVRTYNALVDEVEGLRGRFNERVDAQAARLDAHNKGCAKSYYKDDLAAAKEKAGIVVADNALKLGAGR